ncbi:nuclear factor interleukin-3-regulated protein-like [Pecten maximus]|uniref:nuclear factor interleukin-3-regulated protein-like n=1 Tax=Pecten maximus TaxID=6579 RepID=UPI001458846A|nr:nuclear factor interleukin-3-regulated protein-like [Pecten maximus]
MNMVKVANLIRTEGKFYCQNSILCPSYRPDRPSLLPHSELSHSNFIPPMFDNTYQKKLEMKLLLEQGCLPIQTESSTHHLLESKEDVGKASRAKRQFVPNNKKDGSYWLKRCKNNDSARRSRFKRKCLDKILEKKLAVLQNENCQLRNELRMYKQNSRTNSTNTFVSNTAESASLSNVYPYFNSMDNFPNKFLPEEMKPMKWTNPSGDENDSPPSSVTQDSGDYPNSSSSPYYTSDPEAWKSMCSSQSIDGGSSSDSNTWTSDVTQGGLIPKDSMEEKISSLLFGENIQKVPHKLRIKKNVRSIVETSYASDDKDSSRE